MLQKQTIPLPLVRGLDRSTADQLRAPDALSEGLNVEQKKSGEVSKRPGFETLVTATGTARTLVPLNNSVAVLDSSGDLEILNDAEDGISTVPNSTAVSQVSNSFGEASAKVKSFLGTIQGIQNYDVHIVSDRVYAFVNGNFGARLYRFDRNLNQISYGPAGYVSVLGAEGKFSGSRLFTRGNGSRLNAYDITTGSLLVTNVLATTVNGTNAWEVCEGTAGRFIFAYRDATAIQIYVLDSSLATVGSTTLASTNWKLHALLPQVEQGTFCLLVGRLAAAGNRTEILRYDETPALIASLTESSAALYEAYNICGVYGDSTDSWMFVEYDPSTKAGGFSYDRVVAGVKFNSTFAVNGTYVISSPVRRAGLASKPFILDDAVANGSKRPHVFLSYQSEDTNNLQNCYFLTRVNAGSRVPPDDVVAQLQYGQGNNFISSLTYRHLPSVPSFADGVHFTALFNRLNSQFALSAANAAFSLVGCDITLDTYYSGSKAAKLGGQTLFASGALLLADPDQVTEYGFFVYPDPPALGETTGGGLTTTATYSYVLVYEFYDARGNLIESSPSQPATITLTGANDRVNVTCRLVGWTSKNSMRVSLYRTLANGTTYYYVESKTTYTTDPLTFYDISSDANIQTNRLLWTTGGVAETIQPSNPMFIAAAKNRLWTFENGSEDTLWFSNKPSEGFLPAFSDLLTVKVPNQGGELVGVAQIDDKLVIFKESSVYIIFGDGPTSNLQGSFSEPYAIVQGMGCINARSIVETPVGVLYQAQEGIYLIDRSLQNVFLGRPLYKEEGTILGSTYDPVLNRVFFVSTSQIWVLYLTTQAWYEWSAQNPLDLLYEGGQLWLVKDNGNGTSDLMKQGANWQDDGANYEQKIKLGQFQFSGVQGYQRLYRVLLTGKDTGDADSSNVTVKVYNDANTSAQDTLTIAHDSLITGNRMELEVRPSKQRCETMEVELSLTANTSGLTVAAATAEVGGYTGAGRRSETRRA